MKYDPDIDAPLDPLDAKDPGASEFSWSGGLTPKSLENAGPDRGGRYRGQSPDMGP